MNFIKRFLTTIVVVGAAVLALFFALILAGATKSVTTTTEFLGTTITTVTSSSIKFLSLAFGGAKLVTTTVSGDTTSTIELDYDGGMSIFALIAFILILLSIVVMIASVLIKNKKIGLIGSILLVLAGIASFLILVVGTDVSVTTKIVGSLENTTVTPFAEVFEGYKLGAGAIVCGVLCILGGLFGAYKSIKR